MAAWPAWRDGPATQPEEQLEPLLASECALVGVFAQMPRNADAARALGRLACTCTALRAVVPAVWRPLCLAWWPSCADVDYRRAPPSAWLAFVLCCVGVDAPASAPALRMPLMPARSSREPSVSVVLLDVVSGPAGDACIFSASLWIDDLHLDEDVEAEEFEDAEDAELYGGSVEDSRRLLSQAHLFVRLTDGNNYKEPGQALQFCITRLSDDAADAADDAGGIAELQLTAFFKVLHTGGRIAVLESDTATLSLHAPDDMHEDADRNEQASHVLRWSCRFECEGHSVALFLNLYCCTGPPPPAP
jgi:hypothetical protein